jgi:hypothetical protein
MYSLRRVKANARRIWVERLGEGKYNWEVYGCANMFEAEGGRRREDGRERRKQAERGCEDAKMRARCLSPIPIPIPERKIEPPISAFQFMTNRGA